MERGLLNIVNYGRHDRFRHVILCLTEAGEFARHLRSPSCRVIELHKRPGNDFSLVSRISQVARECGISVLHARGWPTLIETALAARFAGIKATIYGFHGKTVEELKGIGAMRRIAQGMALRSYRRVVTLNSRMRSDLAGEAHLKEARIHVIANGVDVRAFEPSKSRDALRMRYGIPTDRFVVGSIARLDPVKNHEVILRAMAAFRPGERPYFLLVGEGSHRKVLEDMIVELELERDVLLVGYSNQVVDYLGCMDVYIQSSFYEGFSNTILEAMSCGLPVVATDVGGTADLFSSKREGYFFDPSDHVGLAELLRGLQADADMRAALGAAGRARAVQRFSVERMVEAYEDMYLSVASAYGA